MTKNTDPAEHVKADMAKYANAAEARAAAQAAISASDAAEARADAAEAANAADLRAEAEAAYDAAEHALYIYEKVAEAEAAKKGAK